MNPHNVAIWHPSHSDGVVLWVWFLAGHHREPDVEVCQAEEEAGGPPDPLEESNKEDEEFSSDEGFPHAHTLCVGHTACSRRCEVKQARSMGAQFGYIGQLTGFLDYSGAGVSHCGSSYRSTSVL